MKIGRGLAALGAIAGGFVQGDRMFKKDAQDEEDRKLRNEEAQLRLANARRLASDQQELADAGRTAVVQPNITNDDDGNPSSAPALRVVGPGAVQNFNDPTAANTAAMSLNDVQARRSRQVAALDAQGKPGDAISLENAATTQKRTAFTFTKEQEERARQLKDEGYLDAARATRTGDPQAVFDTFNKTGKTKLAAVPTVTPAERDIPGIGKVTTYDYSGAVIGEDGTPKPFKVNSHDLSMQALPYEKALEFQRKGSDSDNKFMYQSGLLDLKGKQVELAGEVAAAKAARASSGGGDKTSREERLRYTSLFTDAGRRQAEAQKALSKLQSDPLYMSQSSKPGSPQAQEMADLRQTIKEHADERSLYQSLLAGSQTKTPSLADAKPSAAAAPKQITTKAERDKLPKGTKYTGPDGQLYVKQ